MEANAPEKIYLLKSQNRMLDGWYNELPIPKTFEQVEYTRTDAFIEKAVSFIRSCTTYDGLGYKAKCVDIKEFVKAMKGE